jgi:hypothetical protein
LLSRIFIAAMTGGEDETRQDNNTNGIQIDAYEPIAGAKTAGLGS